MYKKINKGVQENKVIVTKTQENIPQETHLHHSQHKAQFNIESNQNLSLNNMKSLSHDNFIQNTNNMRNNYQEQYLNKSNNMNLNLGFRG